VASNPGGALTASPRRVYFDQRVAPFYDATSTDMFDPAVLEPTVDFLAELVGDGDALEFAVGTGRVALPLSQRGVRVVGIDLSGPMVAELEKKDGADAISVTIGDFSTTRVEGEFALVYLVYNTITNLVEQDAQVETFANAAAHLKPGGCFVIECFIPQLQRLALGDTALPFHVSPTRLGFDEYDVVNQGLVSHHYWLVGDRLETFVQPFRYLWPAEMDLMAKMAGLRLRERWADWQRNPFTATNDSAISVWEKL